MYIVFVYFFYLIFSLFIMNIKNIKVTIINYHHVTSSLSHYTYFRGNKAATYHVAERRAHPVYLEVSGP